jgi:plastocyanin
VYAAEQTQQHRRFSVKASRLTIGLLPIVALLAIWALATPLRLTAADQSVSIAGFAFAPPTVTINIGDTVTWTNNDGAMHTTTSDTPGLWDSGDLGTSATFQHTFSQAGTFPYHCERHPGMQATVVVQAPGGTSTPTRTSTHTPTRTHTATPTRTATTTATNTTPGTPTQTRTATATSATPGTATPHTAYIPIIERPPLLLAAPRSARTPTATR